MNEGSKALLALLGLIAATVIQALWGGYVFSVLWAWFIVAVFSAPALSIAQAIGVTMAARFAVKSWAINKGEEQDAAKSMVGAFVGPLLVLAVAWIVKQWLPA